MLHFLKEGNHLYSGLNVKLKKWSVSFTWASYVGYNVFTHYIRFRLLPYGPKIFFGKSQFNLIDTYLFDTDNVITTRQKLQKIREKYGTNC